MKRKNSKNPQQNEGMVHVRMYVSRWYSYGRAGLWMHTSRAIVEQADENNVFTTWRCIIYLLVQQHKIELLTQTHTHTHTPRKNHMVIMIKTFEKCSMCVKIMRAYLPCALLFQCNKLLNSIE